MARIKICDNCGHEEFFHLYQTQICTARDCRCDRWKEPAYEQYASLVGLYE
ncbi:MAG TPA: hypothetical protein VED17_04575 [Nitrososphaerales archaeon]|nr:hypothetical protein [Nitrososphaerales archaeon]